MRLGPARTAETPSDRVISAPQPASHRHTEISPPAACVTSLQVQPWRSLRRARLRFPHGSRTTHAQRTAEGGRKTARQDLPSRVESGAGARLGFPPIDSSLDTSLVVRACLPACVRVRWVESIRNSPNWKTVGTFQVGRWLQTRARTRSHPRNLRMCR